jgi:hypothetical protein
MDLLKARMDRADDFYLAEALSRRHYEMSHLQGRSTSPASSWTRRRRCCRTSAPRSSSTA